MIEAETGDDVLVTLVLNDGATGLFPQVEVYDDAGVAIAGSPFDLTHTAEGLYQDTFTSPAAGDYSCVFITYTDAGHTTEGIYERVAEQLRVRAPTEDQVWDALQANHTVAGSFGQDLDVAISTRAAPGDAMDLIAGAVDAAAIATDAIDADAIAADAIGSSELATTAVNEIRDSILSDSTPFAGANIDAAISSRAVAGDAMALTAAAVDSIWDEPQAGHVTAGTFGLFLDVAVSSRAAPGAAMDLVAGAVDATAVATDAIDADALATTAVNEIRDSILSDSTPFAGANIDAAITTRAVAGDAMALTAAAVDAIWDELIAGHLGVGSTGEALDAASSGSSPGAIADAVWDEARAGHATAGTFGEQLQTAPAVAGDAMALTAAAVDAIWDEPIAGHLGAGSTGEALDAASSGSASPGDIADAVWDEARAAHTAVGSFGEALDVAVSTRAAPGDAMDIIPGAIDAPAFAANAIDSSALATSAVNEIRDSILSDSTPFAGGAIDANISTRAVPGDAMTLTAGADASIADAVWDELLAGHLAVGSTGEALSDAQTGASPAAVATAVWSEALPGAFAAGTAGERLASTDDNADVAVSTRSSHTAGDVDSLLGTNHGAGSWEPLDDWSSTERAQIRGALGIVGTQATPAGGGELQDLLADTAAIDARLPTDPADESVQLAQHASTQADIAALNDLAIVDVQTALTNQGYTAARAPNLDDLDAAVSSRAVPGDAMDLIAGAVNGTSFAASAGDVVAAEVWDEIRAGHAGVGSFGEALQTTVGSRAAPGDAMALTVGERGSVADAIWDEPIAGHTGAGSTGEALDNASAPTAGAVADAVWDESRAAHVGAGSFGEALDATVSSRATQADILSDATPFAGALVDAAVSTRAAPLDPMTLSAGERTTLAGVVWDEALPGAHAVGTAGERLATTDDSVDVAVSTRAAPGDTMVLGAGGITGVSYAASALDAIADAIWDELLAGHAGVGSTGEALADAAFAASAPSAADVADAVWDESRAGHAAGGSFGESLQDTVSSRAIAGDAMALTAGERTSTAGVVWDEGLPGAHAAGTAGERLATTDDNVDVAVSSRSSHSAADVDTTLSGAHGAGAWTSADVGAGLTAQGYTAARAPLLDNLDVAVSTRAAPGDAMALDSTAIDAIWDELAVGHLASGSFGEALRLAFAHAGGHVRDDALTYDTNNRPLLIRRRVFPDKATADLSTPGSTGEGEVATFTFAATHIDAARWNSLLRTRDS